MTATARHAAAAHPPRALLALLLALGAALLHAPPALAAEADHDLWYIIEMAGQRSGWMRSTQRTEGDRIITIRELQLEIRRGRTPITVRNVSEFVETPTGEPISMKNTQQLGSAPVTTEYTFAPDKVTIVTSQPGFPPTQIEASPPEGQWLTPAAALEFTRKRLEAGANEIVVRSVDPAQGLQPVVFTRKILERTTAEALGKTVPAIKTSVSMSNMAGIESVEFVDERGMTIRSTTNLGDIPMTMIAAERELAMADVDPPELMQRTFVTPDRGIPSPRKVRSAAYLLRVPGDGPALAEIPATGAQRVEPAGDDAIRITIDADDLAPADPADADNPEFTAASSMLNSEDERVKELVERALRPLDEGATPAQRAEALRRYVHTFIRAKGLGVGFATASEVARTREGDCTEHAALLAAMLRAAGIPSRTASGLIYADAFAGSEHIFGYHMWTQALLTIDGVPRWVDLDATLGPQTPFDATHIALAVTSMTDGQAPNALIALTPLLGRLEITVEHISAAAPEPVP
jgi:hypothetical protein